MSAATATAGVAASTAPRYGAYSLAIAPLIMVAWVIVVTLVLSRNAGTRTGW
jgi:hypothetical protein